MRRVLAGVLTVGVMASLFWMGIRRTAPTAPPATGPSVRESPDAMDDAEAAVRAVIASAQRGDVASYRAAFAGPLRERIERDLQQSGPDQFANQLRRAAGARKSHAVFAAEPDGPNAVRITVESVYPDRNERQTYRLEQQAVGWRITDVESVRTQMPKARYGTFADYQEPEGVPVKDLGSTEPLRAQHDVVEETP